MKRCPKCKSSIAWLSVEPKFPDLSCHQCGLVYPAPAEEKACTWGILVGNWDELEIEKLERHLTTGSTDWTFIKGRRLWFAFRDFFDAKDVIACNLLDDMLDWVEVANEKPRWRQLYSQHLGKK